MTHPISLRIPPELLARIDAFASSQSVRCSRSLAILKLIHTGLGAPARPEPGSMDEAAGLASSHSIAPREQLDYWAWVNRGCIAGIGTSPQKAYSDAGNTPGLAERMTSDAFLQVEAVGFDAAAASGLVRGTGDDGRPLWIISVLR